MKVYIIAGEPSGDLLASGMMGALRGMDPGVEFYGLGGESMKSLGFESLFDISDIAVMGIFEVVPRLPVIFRRIRQTVEDIEAHNPDVLVTVDSWGFASAVITKLRKRNTKIPVVHYVAPQVWAWKKGRARNVARLVDRLMMLLPNEGQYFEKYGLKCDFVGHPVIERMSGVEYDTVGFRTRYDIPQDATVVCALPGSRRGEIKRLAPVLRRSLEIIKEKYGEIVVVVPTVGYVADMVREQFEGMDMPLRVVTGKEDKYNAFRTSSVALAVSGTVSLELTAAGTPHLIVYTFNFLTNWLVRNFINTRYANLINILVQRPIIPEYVLMYCKPELIAAGALELLTSPEAAQKQIGEAGEVLATLRPEGMMPSERAAQIVIEAATKPH